MPEIPVLVRPTFGPIGYAENGAADSALLWSNITDRNLQSLGVLLQFLPHKAGTPSGHVPRFVLGVEPSAMRLGDCFHQGNQIRVVGDNSDGDISTWELPDRNPSPSETDDLLGQILSRSW